MMFYTVEIYEEDGGLYALIVRIGRMTSWSIIARAEKVADGSVQFVFEAVQLRDDGRRSWWDIYDTSVLFSFAREGDDIITTWGSIQPIIEQNEEPGRHFREIFPDYATSYEYINFLRWIERETEFPLRYHWPPPK